MYLSVLSILEVDYIQFHSFPSIPTASTQVVSNYSQIWYGSGFFSQHHNLLNSAVQCPVPQPVQLLTEFPSWNNYPAPANKKKWTKTTCRHFIGILTPFSRLQGVAGGVEKFDENHPLLHYTSTPTHSYIRFTFPIYPYHCLPLSWPS